MLTLTSTKGMQGTKGVVMMIWSNRAYGYAAHNFAMSIKHITPDLPIFLISDAEAFKGIRTPELFDDIEMMHSTPTDPAMAKMQIYDKLPFDHNLYLDVDALCLFDINIIFDECINDEREYRCAVHTWYDKHSPEVFPLMVWANKSTIWNHYQFTDQKMPATQSSIQYIRKGAFCESLFGKIQANYANRIPVNMLKNKWGGGQPDELYLNVTLAQLGYDPTLNDMMYFGDDISVSFSKITAPILSMFGTAQNIKPQFVRGYDATLSKLSSKMGLKHTEWKRISGNKIANKSSSPRQVNDGMGRGAFEKRFFAQAKLDNRPIEGSVYLFTSYFESENVERQSELNRCMAFNCANENITRIYNLGLAYDHPKVVNLDYDRPTYQDFINEANKAAGDYSIICNSDIYFDHTLRWIDKVDLTGVMIALCRYDIKGGSAKLFPFAHSQDSWIFKGRIAIESSHYIMGKPGCDNRFAYDAIAHGYRVINPAKDIKSYHLHESNHRTYTEGDRLEGNYQSVLISSILTLPKANNKRVLIIQPGKVGDILIVLPIAKYYSDKGYKVEWLCPMQYHYLFKYVDYVIPVTVNNGEYSKTIDLSFGLNTKSEVHKQWIRRKPTLDSFVTLKYELSGVPISELRNLVYNRNIEKEKELFDLVTSELYILIHSSTDYGTPIEVDSDLEKIYFTPQDGFSIFDWRKVIENASEIHCIDSSLANFVDSLQVRGSLYYYPTDRVPMQCDRTKLVKPWEVVDKILTI